MPENPRHFMKYEVDTRQILFSGKNRQSTAVAYPSPALAISPSFTAQGTTPLAFGS